MKIKETKLFKWLDNYWYHYKWRTIIIGSFALIVLVCLIQSLKTPDYDTNILYSGPYIMSQAELDSFEDAVKCAMTGDYNGDGKKEINIISMAIMSDEQLKEYSEQYEGYSYATLYQSYSYDAMLQNFYTEAYTGESLVGFCDEGLYELLLKKDSLYTLNEVLGYTHEGAFSEYGIYLKDTEFGKYFTVMANLPENTVICFRKPSSTSIFRTKTAENERYDNSVLLLSDILAFKAPQTEN